MINAKNSKDNNQILFKETNDKHNELYENYKQKQMRLQQLSDQIYSEFNFTPETNKNQNIETNFFERQENNKKRLQDKEIE